jgi:hypothetical protein
MRFSFIKHSVTKSMGLLGLLSLGFVQAGCAHQVMVEPAVVFNSRLGDASVSVQVGVPGVVVFPPPHVVYSSPQPRVIYAPLGYSVPVYRNPHAWVYAERRDVWGGRHPSEHRRRHWEERDHRRDHGRGHDQNDHRWDGRNGRNSR